MSRSLITFVVLAGIAFGENAVHAEGDAEVGRELAAEWCSRCHDIGPEGQMKQEPPSFAAIAVYRGADQIRSKIIVPHIGMPEHAQILGFDADDLTAYIVSLEEQ